MRTGLLINGGLIVLGVTMALFWIGMFALFAVGRLITEVRTDGLYVRFIPFHFAFVRIPWDDLRSWEAVTYNPIRDYGGWGIRCGFKGRAYNVSGNRGVRLVKRDGRVLLIGSQRAEELDRAMNAGGRRTGD